MNKFTLLPLFLLLFINAKAQDRIISLKNNDGSVTGQSISLSQVSEYLKLYQPETPKKLFPHENRFCLGLDAGYSVMPWYVGYFQIVPKIPDFYDRLKTGLHINAGAHFMITGLWGLGAEYSFFKTDASGTMPIEYPSSMFIIQSEKCRLYINYLGASVLFRQYLDARQKFTVSESLSAGILFLRLEDQSTYPEISWSGYTDFTDNLLLTGNSFSGKFGLAAGYRLYGPVSVGLSSNFIWGTLKNGSFESRGSDRHRYTSGKQKLPEALKLSRIDYSFVLRCCF